MGGGGSKSNCNETKSKLDDTLKKLSSAKSQISELTAAQKKLQSEVSKVKTQLEKEKNEALSKQSDENAKLVKNIDSYKQKVEECAADVTQAGKKLEEAESERKELQASVEESTKKVAEVKLKLSDLQNKSLKTNEDLEQAQKKLGAAEDEIQNCNKGREFCNKRVKRLICMLKKQCIEQYRIRQRLFDITTRKTREENNKKYGGSGGRIQAGTGKEFPTDRTWYKPFDASCKIEIDRCSSSHTDPIVVELVRGLGCRPATTSNVKLGGATDKCPAIGKYTNPKKPLTIRFLCKGGQNGEMVFLPPKGGTPIPLPSDAKGNVRLSDDAMTKILGTAVPGISITAAHLKHKKTKKYLQNCLTIAIDERSGVGCTEIVANAGRSLGNRATVHVDKYTSIPSLPIARTASKGTDSDDSEDESPKKK